MTSPSTRAVRVGDVEPEQARLLHRIHTLATESARQRREIPVTERQVADWVHLSTRLDEIHRERELTEITAREHGVPPGWIELARARGIQGRGWTGDQLLPAATPVRGQRARNRIAADARRLAYMAAVHTVRNHLRAIAGLTIETDPRAVDRFERNFRALRNRVAEIAASPAVSAAKVTHAFDTATELLAREIGQYLTYPLADLDALWQPLTSRAMASDLRRALKSLRAAAPESTSDHNRTLVPTSEDLLGRAHEILYAATTVATAPESVDGAVIEAAISAGLGESAALDWEPDTDPRGTGTAEQRALAADAPVAEPP
ncbi:hypothetical protein ACWDYH_31300 [Nocardia goodfellowii]